MIVVTEGYLREVDSSQSSNARNLAGKIARHIFQLTKIELCNSACANFRFIPVLCDKVSRRDLPLMLANTKVYSWPAGWESLIRFIACRAFQRPNDDSDGD